MSRFLVTASGESMKRPLDSRGSDGQVSVNQFARLVAGTGHQVSVARERLLDRRVPMNSWIALGLTPASINRDLSR